MLNVSMQDRWARNAASSHRLMRRLPWLPICLVTAALVSNACGVAPGSPPTAPVPTPSFEPVGDPPTWTTRRVGGVAFGFDSAWIAANSNLYRIDPTDNRLLATIKVGSFAAWPVVALGSVWVRTSEGTVRVDPAANTVVGRIDAGRVFGLDNFWDTAGPKVLAISPETGKATARFSASAAEWEPQITVAFDALWIASGGDHVVTRIDPRSQKITARTEALSSDYSLLTIGADDESIWAHANAAGIDGILYRIDPRSLEVTAIPVGGSEGSGYGATNIGIGGGSIWTGSAGRTISRVDAKTNEVVGNLTIAEVPLFISYGFDSVWVSSETSHGGAGSVTRYSVSDFTR